MHSRPEAAERASRYRIQVGHCGAHVESRISPEAAHHAGRGDGDQEGSLFVGRERRGDAGSCVPLWRRQGWATPRVHEEARFGGWRTADPSTSPIALRVMATVGMTVRIFRWLFVVLALIAVLMTVCAARSASLPEDQLFTRVHPAMGTDFTLYIYAPD